MKDQNFSIFHKLNCAFLSFFGTGYSPFAPGTVGSLATIPLILLLNYLNANFITVLVLTLFIFLYSCYSAHIIQNRLKIFDPGWIVIDEVVGMLITWLFVFPLVDTKSLVAVFVLFRVFDIIKIWPASYFDKKMKNGFATIFDDVISALYAGFVIVGLKYFNFIA